MARVFLSYAREDATAAERLAADVEGAGHVVWWDHHIQGGSRFASEIDRELKNADAVVVLWSRTSIDSPWVQDEAAEARDSGRLVPVTISAGKPPLGFRQFQAVDFGEWDGSGEAAALGALLNAIAQKSGAASATAAPAAQAAKGRARRATVCVLPFVNMSGDPEQEYFSDGITEDIITDLSRISALSVIARNTAFAFKGQTIDLKELAKTLGVDHVLEGSVRKVGNRVRITAQLIDAKAGDHHWADRYDRDLNDIFAIQDEISKEIARALQLKLLPEEEEAIESRGTASAEAYNLYLMARQYWVGGTMGSSRRDETIVRICKQAVAIDPRYGEAWALMALAQAELRFWHSLDVDPLPAADHALEINPDLAEARCVKVRNFEELGKVAEADRELEEALKLAPDSWEVNREAARVMFKRGRMADAVRHYETASNLMDGDFHSCSMLMSCYIAIGDEEGALEAARRTIKRSEAAVAKDPANGAALAAGATALIALGEIERGKDWIQRAQMLDPDNLAVLYNLACGLTFKNADIDGALDLLQQWSESAPLAYVRYAEIDPDIDPVRDNPRYKAMIAAAEERLGMTEQS